MEYSEVNESPRIRMIHGDCMDFMRDLPDNAYELAIVDPPYGIGVNKMNMGSRRTVRPDERRWDNAPPQAEYFHQLRRVSKAQIIWGGNYFDLPPTRSFIIWDKGEMMKGRSFAECEQAWTSFNQSARIFKQSPVQPNRIHPTQKPIKLYRWLLQNYATPGDRILDTHVGSGSIAIACLEEGFDLDWIELDRDYYDAAVKRFHRHKAQGALFP